MNQFDELYEFRMASENEIDKIMAFIGRYWGNPNHILATDRDFFVYEYCTLGFPSVFLAIEKTSKEIAAMQCLYFYEKEYIAGKSDMATGMFLANPSCHTPFIGIELHKRVLDILKPRSYIAPGVNLRTSAPLLKRFLKHRVERMRQFYILGNNKEFNVADIKKVSKAESKFSYKQLDMKYFSTADEMYAEFDDESFRSRMPYKDRWYIERRYFNHPIYKYKLYGITNRTVIVFREIMVEKTRILRIVDILGEPGNIRYAANAFQNLINIGQYEYLDIYEQTMDENDLHAAGFVERLQDDINIIPNYFEPYVKRNVEIWVNRRDEISYCFKADGDQDRPNYR